ncbi:MAG: helix-turn-helix domain-containing protein [Monoglobales bacterium]
MDLKKSGELLCNLRKAKGLSQKDVAEKLGLQPKTVSKWETGHGFPDVSYVAELSKILGVSAESLLMGYLAENREEDGNMKRIKFYVCPDCGGILYGTGEGQVICCGKQLSALKPSKDSDNHKISISEIENDYYITFDHEMTKNHYIGFVAMVSFDKILLAKLYPEQDPSVRLPRINRGKFYYYCSKHGLFEF